MWVMMFQESIQVIAKGFRAVLSRKVVLFKAFVLVVAFQVLLSLSIPYIRSFLGHGSTLLVMVVGGILSLFLYVFVCVVTHRVLIIDERNTALSRIKSVGAREWQFLLALFEVIFYCLPCIIFLWIPYIGEYIAMVVGAYILSRVSLIFPSIAIDVPMNARASWQATKKKQVLMFTVVFLYSIFFAVLEWALSGLGGIFSLIFHYITLVFLVGALSEAYKTIMSEVEI